MVKRPRRHRRGTLLLAAFLYAGYSNGSEESAAVLQCEFKVSLEINMLLLKHVKRLSQHVRDSSPESSASACLTCRSLPATAESIAFIEKEDRKKLQALEKVLAHDRDVLERVSSLMDALSDCTPSQDDEESPR